MKIIITAEVKQVANDERFGIEDAVKDILEKQNITVKTISVKIEG